MIRLFYISLALLFSLNANSLAKGQYPNVDGQILFEIRSDTILSTDAQNLKSNAGYINIEPDFSLNFNENWSLKTGWRFLPVRQRQYEYPERQRFILGNDIAINRGFNQDEMGGVIEELKINFENEDMRFQAGKLNPTFATLYRRNKRIGLFVTDITEDYELREMIGFSGSALLEDSEITISTFFRDTTGLSDSAFESRDRRNRNDGISANTGTLSSYSVTIEGRRFFGVRNLFYNFGYRSLGVDDFVEESARESAFTANLEYLYRFGRAGSLIPVFEYVKIDNFTGRKDRDADYLTTSLIAKYSGWNASLTAVFRNIDNNYETAPLRKNRDYLYQFNVGYKFNNNIALDISRAEIKEDNINSSNLGFIMSYLYQF